MRLARWGWLLVIGGLVSGCGHPADGAAETPLAAGVGTAGWVTAAQASLASATGVAPRRRLWIASMHGHWWAVVPHPHHGRLIVGEWLPTHWRWWQWNPRLDTVSPPATRAVTAWLAPLRLGRSLALGGVPPVSWGPCLRPFRTLLSVPGGWALHPTVRGLQLSVWMPLGHAGWVVLPFRARFSGWRPTAAPYIVHGSVPAPATVLQSLVP